MSSARADDVLPVSVVVPTAGRARLLAACLASLGACHPRAAEILVVDQSGDAAVAQIVERSQAPGARLIHCAGRGVSKTSNEGLRHAAFDIVLVTHDDCTVARDWVANAWSLMSVDEAVIVTGRVLPAGDPYAIPSTREDPTPHDHSGEIACGALFPNNMAIKRSIALGMGGFDERFGPDEPAEDNDFCYRWLREGYRLLYEPRLIVWHFDWRTPEQLGRLYFAYGRGQGYFYAKHLRKGDLRMLRFIARDVYAGFRALASAGLRGRPRGVKLRGWEFLTGLPRGFLKGWHEYGAVRGPWN